MAIKRDVKYPGRWNPADSDFPMGGPKNRTTATSLDGSFFDREFMADYESFFQRLMTEAGIAANESSDTAPTSQFFSALESVMASTPSDWDADVVSQAESEAGTAETARKWTAQRVRQSIVQYSAAKSGSSDQTFSVATPTSAEHAATKSYVDSVAATTYYQGFDPRETLYPVGHILIAYFTGEENATKLNKNFQIRVMSDAAQFVRYADPTYTGYVLGGEDIVQGQWKYIGRLPAIDGIAAGLYQRVI